MPSMKKSRRERRSAANTRLLVLLDWPELLKHSARNIEKLVARRILRSAKKKHLEQYIAGPGLLGRLLGSGKKRPPTALVCMPGPEQHRWYLLLAQDFVCEVRPIEGLQAVVVERILLPEESRALYELRAGTKTAIPVESYISWHISDEERAIRATCPVCEGSKKVECRACKGSGKFRNKKGRLRPCACGSGKRDCPYCKSAGLISCRIIEHDGNKIPSLPSKHRDYDGYRYSAGGHRIAPGVSPVLREAALLARREIEEQQTPLSPGGRSSAKTKNILSRADQNFAKRLAEMRELLRIELDCELRNKSCASLERGKALEDDAGGSGTSILVQYEITSAWPADWHTGAALLFYGASAATPRKTYIHSVSSTHVTLSFRKRRSQSKLSRTGKLLPREAGRLVNVQLAALRYWENADSLEHQLKRAILLPSSGEPEKPARLNAFYNEQVRNNQAQRLAVETVVSEAYPLVCIQGPPGTGKTSVICEIVRQELRKSNARVLISSQSNLAVDNVLERLCDDPSIKPLRIGNSPKVLSSLHANLPEQWTPPRSSLWQLLRNAFRRGSSSGEHERSLTKKYQAARVIGATCIGSEHPIIRAFSNESARNPDGFSLVIIDEGARSTPMETLVPMQRAHRCVLVGDHKQLPPVITSEVREQWQDLHPGMDIEHSPAAVSLFEQVLPSLPTKARIVLSMQFRMHPDIASFVSEVFYAEENLQSGVTNDDRSLPLPLMPPALSYHPTSGYGSERFDRKEGTSRVNLAEARSVEKVLSFLERNSKDVIDVGIITFYKAQVGLLQNQIAKRHFEKLSIDPQDGIATLDSFQGKEKDVIILSLVRSPQGVEHADAEWYRFFLDIRRLNVALSRARRRLCIIGDIERILEIQKNRENLEGFLVLERLYNYIRRNNSLVEELPRLSGPEDLSKEKRG